MTANPTPDALPNPTRSIVLLAVAGFASQAQVRVTDSLLPQIAGDFGTTVGAAAMVVTAYAVAHGSVQLFIGPIGDRFGKYLTVMTMCLASSILVMACGLANSLTELAIARLLAGACAGWVIPLSMAYVGDVTPYDRRQPVLGRYLTGQITGQLFGQAAGGVLGDLFGWRNVFFILGAMFALATLGLIYELITNPRTRPAGRPEERSRGFVADYKAVLSNPWARIVILAVFLESFFGWGAFAYVGADLNQRFGLSLTAVGLIVGCFAIGGLVYATTVQQLVNRFGQTRARDRRRDDLRRWLSGAGERAGLVARAARGRALRPRLLRAAQHLADLRHADDAGSARDRLRAVLVRHLCRTDRRRRHERDRVRPRRRRAAVDRGGSGAAGDGAVVRARAQDARLVVV